MNGLLRQLAPLSERAWKVVEHEATERLRLHLTARRLVDFTGPFGWSHSVTDLGRLELVSDNGVLIRRRVVRPLLELRLPFTLEREQLERIDRGASTVDLRPLHAAARAFATAEDELLYFGSAGADLPGLLTGADQKPVLLHPNALYIPDAVTQALEQLRLAGVAGPYAVALGTAAHSALSSGTGEGGYPVRRHVEGLIERPVLLAPSLPGGVVVSLRGDDFQLVCGADVAIGYESHDADSVTLFFQESLSFVLNGPEAAVPLLTQPLEKEPR